MIFRVGFGVALLIAGFFIFRTVSLQPLLVQAKSDNSQLKTQLDQAKADSVSARANANELSDTVTQLQAQQKQLQNQTATANANAEKADGEISGLQAQLRQAQNQAAMARAEAQKTAAELARLQARLQSTTATAPAPAVVPTVPPPVTSAVTHSKPMPVSVSFRKAEVGDGNSVLVQNISDTDLLVNVTFTNPSSTGSKTYHLKLAGGSAKELGSLGAWKLSPGDRVQIDSTGFDSIVRTAP